MVWSRLPSAIIVKLLLKLATTQPIAWLTSSPHTLKFLISSSPSWPRGLDRKRSKFLVDSWTQIMIHPMKHPMTRCQVKVLQLYILVHNVTNVLLILWLKLFEIIPQLYLVIYCSVCALMLKITPVPVVDLRRYRPRLLLQTNATAVLQQVIILLLNV